MAGRIAEITVEIYGREADPTNPSPKMCEQMDKRIDGTHIRLI